ncbi:A24 family peptidase [Paenibacillus herberti]|uniref:A24 family peptidase n=1 Tax=Paenibacillus herberti TaxID=1619309 RepID=UPI0015957560|nr:A24 family peptidase [Paenibacillus herberti]
MTSLIWVGTALLLGTAFWSDVRTMRIPNELTGGFFAAGLLIHVSIGGMGGLGKAALGAAAGFIPLLLLYFLRGIGAGDVKLFGAIGAWIGAASVLELMLYSMLLGGIGGGIYLLAVKLRRRISSIIDRKRDSDSYSDRDRDCDRNQELESDQVHDANNAMPRPPVRFPFMIAVMPAAIAMQLLG